MASYNKVILIGNHTRDPEITYTPSGVAIAKFSLAVNRTWKGEDGEKREEVSFIDCTAFGKVAETIGEYQRKGDPTMVEGRLKLDTWKDKTTKENRQKLAVIVETFQFLNRAPGKDEDDGERKSKPAARRQTKPAKDDGSQPDPMDSSDDDVPF